MERPKFGRKLKATNGLADGVKKHTLWCTKSICLLLWNQVWMRARFVYLQGIQVVLFLSMLSVYCRNQCYMTEKTANVFRAPSHLFPYSPQAKDDRISVDLKVKVFTISLECRKAEFLKLSYWIPKPAIHIESCKYVRGWNFKKSVISNKKHHWEYYSSLDKIRTDQFCTLMYCWWKTAYSGCYLQASGREEGYQAVSVDSQRGNHARPIW